MLGDLCKDCTQFWLPSRTKGYVMSITTESEPDPNHSRCKFTDKVTGTGECGTICADEREDNTQGHCGKNGNNFSRKQ